MDVELEDLKEDLEEEHDEGCEDEAPEKKEGVIVTLWFFNLLRLSIKVTTSMINIKQSINTFTN